MSLLGGVGKDTVKQAGDELQEAIPIAKAAATDTLDHGVYGLAGIVADIANRLNGASVPVDITITASVRIVGKIGDVHITPMEYDVK